MDSGAKEAALFYCSVFLGTVENPSVILSVNQMVVSFQLLGNKFLALNGGPVFQKNPSISFFVVCQSAEELETRWQRLVENGEVLMSLAKEDSSWLKKNEPIAYRKVEKLLFELFEHPYSGTGKPKPLSYGKTGQW